MQDYKDTKKSLHRVLNKLLRIRLFCTTHLILRKHIMVWAFEQITKGDIKKARRIAAIIPRKSTQEVKLGYIS